MPNPLTGLRIARSYLSPTGIIVESAVLDFQLGARMGLEIFGVLATGVSGFNAGFLTASEKTGQGVQSLHLESGALEAPPALQIGDGFDIDTEIFWQQDRAFTGESQGGTAGSAMAIVQSSEGMTVFPVPVLSARNISHRAEVFTANHIEGFGVLIYFRYIEFTDAEMGILLARRS